MPQLIASPQVAAPRLHPSSSVARERELLDVTIWLEDIDAAADGPYVRSETLTARYLAVVRGDPDAAEDTPDLMLYVIRDAANATKRGVTPIGRDQLLELARGIAASIRKRPTR